MLRRTIAFAAVTSAILSFCVSSAATAGAASSRATTASPLRLKVGLLYVASGPLGAEFQYALAGAQAHFDYAAAHGGPRITIDPGDTGGDPTRNLQQAQRMVSNGDFAVMEDDIADSGSATYLHSHGVPVVGFALTPYWAQYKNMFGWSGAPATPQSPLVSQPSQAVLSLGGTRLVIVAIGGNQASVASSQALKSAFLKLGGKSAIIDNVQFGQQQFTANVQKIKQAGVNSAIFATDAATGLNYYLAAKQGGVNLKVAVEDNGYGPQTLTQFHSKIAGVYFSDPFAPLELAKTNPEVRTFIEAMKKYERNTGVNNQHAQYGWVMADMILRGLQDAGNTANRAKFITGLNLDKTWDASGLGATVNFANRSVATGCSFYVRVNGSGSAFVPVFGGQPQCGHALSS